MNTQINSKQLSESSIFLGLSPEQIEKILPCITYSIKNYDSNQYIYAKGDIVGNLGLVINGALEICTETADGRKATVTIIEKNELFGEALIFASGRSVPHDVVSREPTTVLYLASDFFMRPCGANCPNKESHGEVMRNMLRILSDRTQALNRKIAYLTAHDLKTKLAMYLYDLHQSLGLLSFNMPLNRDQLSEYLAVARPSLSREFVNMKKAGVIDFYRSSVKIIDLPKLYELAHPS